MLTRDSVRFADVRRRVLTCAGVRWQVPDVALIHDFPVTIANGSTYNWQPRAPVPREVAQLLRQAYYAAVSFVDEQVGATAANPALLTPHLLYATPTKPCAERGEKGGYAIMNGAHPFDWRQQTGPVNTPPL